MLKIFWKILKPGLEYKWWMLLAAFIGFLTVGSSIGLLMTSAYLISKAALMPSIGELQLAIVGVRFFGISRGVFRYFERLISHETTFKLLTKFRVWFFESIEPVAPAKTNKFASGDLLTRSVADIQSLEHIFVRVIAPPIVAAFVLVLMWFLLGIFSFYYSLIFSVCYLTAAIIVPVITLKMSNRYGKEIIKYRTELNETALDSIQGLSELLMFGQFENYKIKFQKIEYKLLAAQRKMALISGLNESITGLLMNVTVAALMIVAVPNISKGLLNGVYLSVLTIGIMSAFEAVLPLPTSLQFLGNSLEAAGRLFKITDMKPDVEDYNLPVQKITEHNIEISNLSFGYSPYKNVFNNLNLTISNHNIIAVVGASGAGKSSIVNLLVKFWNYDNGEIKIGKIPYTQISQLQIRDIISVIPQQIHLFNGTIKDNLLISKENAVESELNYVVEKAGLMNFVNSLPQKLNSWIGEQGLQLSGGERKRLAIARALLKDSPVLICDEITAELDSLNEIKILNTVFEISKRKTVVFITHHLAAMERFNNIYVLKNGEIIESGSHKELIQKSGYYKEMLDNQNQSFEHELF